MHISHFTGGQTERQVDVRTDKRMDRQTDGMTGKGTLHDFLYKCLFNMIH